MNFGASDKPSQTVQHGSSPAAAQSTSGRPAIARAERTVTMLMLGRLQRQGTDTICRIRNVSSGGMRIDTASPLCKGDAVTIEARTGASIAGRIAWTSQLASGVAFDQTIDHHALFGPPSGPSGARVASRSPRFETSATARLDIDGRTIQLRLDNISLGGCRVEGGASFPRQVEGRITIPGLGPLGCCTRWVTGNRAGLVFLTRPQFATFARWLESPELRFTGARSRPDDAPDAAPAMPARMLFSRPRNF
ncbi:PilZ domain-containing protein [Alteriqipengyuania sp. 357]